MLTLESAFDCVGSAAHVQGPSHSSGKRYCLDERGKFFCNFITRLLCSLGVDSSVCMKKLHFYAFSSQFCYFYFSMCSNYFFFSLFLQRSATLYRCCLIVLSRSYGIITIATGAYTLACALQPMRWM